MLDADGGCDPAVTNKVRTASEVMTEGGIEIRLLLLLLLLLLS